MINWAKIKSEDKIKENSERKNGAGSEWLNERTKNKGRK